MPGGMKVRQAWIAAAVALSAALAGLGLGCHVPVQQVPANVEARIPCPHLAVPSSANFSLFKYDIKVASSIASQNVSSADVTFKALARNSSHFILLPAMANRTGLYTCQLEDETSPLEVASPEKQTQTIIVAEAMCSRECMRPFSWAWVVGCGLLTLYGLAITTVTTRIWHKLKRCDSNENDYMNMKPRGLQRYAGAQQPARVKVAK
ncbi:hypothetical protein GN956_G24341 [Arapaima gigas]